MPGRAQRCPAQHRIGEAHRLPEARRVADFGGQHRPARETRASSRRRAVRTTSAASVPYQLVRWSVTSRSRGSPISRSVSTRRPSTSAMPAKGSAAAAVRDGRGRACFAARTVSTALSATAPRRGELHADDRHQPVRLPSMVGDDRVWHQFRPCAPHHRRHQPVVDEADVAACRASRGNAAFTSARHASIAASAVRSRPPQRRRGLVCADQHETAPGHGRQHSARRPALPWRCRARADRGAGSSLA